MVGDFPTAIAVHRMQKFGERFILAEDIQGRHWILDREDIGPIRRVIYFDFYYSESRH